jgi:hypothetical protein
MSARMNAHEMLERATTSAVPTAEAASSYSRRQSLTQRMNGIADVPLEYLFPEISLAAP